MKAVRIISTFLGISMFLFGIVKFVNPFKGWYSAQIINSGLNESLYWPGIMAEISAGVLFIGIVLLRNKVPRKVFSLTIIPASTMVIMLMVTAICTHLHPNVPADVLPLKIKPPFIPGFFLLLAVTNIFLLSKVVFKNNRQKPIANIGFAASRNASVAANDLQRDGLVD